MLDKMIAINAIECNNLEKKYELGCKYARNL